MEVTWYYYGNKTSHTPGKALMDVQGSVEHTLKGSVFRFGYHKMGKVPTSWKGVWEEFRGQERYLNPGSLENV